MDEKRYSTKQVARIVGVTTQTIYNWLRAGTIPEPPRDYRGHRLFRNEDLRLMLAHRGKILPPRDRSVQDEEPVDEV
jgi:excisionase family DNA binding protein